MAKEHSIRVSAKGEFGQLERGLKNLQKDLGGVVGEIDKGARRGGIFDESHLRALDLYKNRFKGTMKELDQEFQKQNAIVDELHRKKEKAQKSEAREIQKTIDLREKELDVIRRQLLEAEKLYEQRTKEAGGYQTVPGGRGGAPNTDMLNEVGKNSKLDKVLGMAGGLGKGALGLAGIGGVGAILSEAYQQAYQKHVGSMDLAQRIRGSAGMSGTAPQIHDIHRDIGLKNNLGYESEEVMAFQDTYSSQAGALNEEQLQKLLEFGRGFGIQSQQLASVMAELREFGGTETPDHFADMVSKSVESSGMTPRILEVMETSAGLLQNINTTMKDTGAQQILAYQTTLDKIGMENGMMKLTGSQGADVISGLGGIFNSQEGNDWKWYGIQALQQYDPEKYGDKSLYEMERSYEDGLLNEDNLPAMTDYLKEKSGGDQELFKRLMQKWLQDGGFDASKRQVDEIMEVTDNMNAFDEDKVRAVLESNESGDASAKYNEERAGEKGQDWLQNEANYQKALEGVGEEFIDVIQKMKEEIGETMVSLDMFQDQLETLLQKIIPDSWEDEFQGVMDTILDNWELVLGGIIGAKGLKKLKEWRDSKKGNADEDRTRGDSDEDRTRGDSDEDRTRGDSDEDRTRGDSDEDRTRGDSDEDRTRGNDPDEEEQRRQNSDREDIERAREQQREIDEELERRNGRIDDIVNDTDTPRPSTPKLGKRILDGLPGIAGAVTLPFTIDEISNQYNERKEMGDTTWGATWKTSLETAHDSIIGWAEDLSKWSWEKILGDNYVEPEPTAIDKFFNPEYVQDEDQANENKMNDFIGSLERVKNMYDGMIQTEVFAKKMPKNDQELEKYSKPVNKQFASNLWENGFENMLDIDTSSKEGIMEAVQVMKTMGFTTEELPKAMKEAMKDHGIDYSSQKRVSEEDLAKAIANIKELEINPASNGRPAPIATDYDPTKEAMENMQGNVQDMATQTTQSVNTMKNDSIASLIGLSEGGNVALDGLSSFGQLVLGQLEEQGLIKLEEMKTGSSVLMNSFTEEGKTSLLSLQQEGLISIGGLQKDGTAQITALNEQGVSKLKQLNEDGLVSLEDFQTEGKKKITYLSEEGANTLLSLLDKGSISFDGMNETTDTKLQEMKEKHVENMDDIKSEHMGIGKIISTGWESFTDTFGDLWDGFLDMLPKWLGGSGDSEVGGIGVSGGGKSITKQTESYRDEVAEAGKKHGITDTNLLLAIMNQESKGYMSDDLFQSSESLGLPRNTLNQEQSIEQGVKYFAEALEKAGGDIEMALQAYNYGHGYIDYAKKNGGHSDETAKAFQQKMGGRYGDADYVDNVLQYYPKMSSTYGSSFFNGWEDRVTSRFGDHESFRKNPHGGLDIDGQQGDMLDALAGGKISFLTVDDGTKHDNDKYGKEANSNPGGTEMGVTMPTGETYFYSHLSKVNPEILERWSNGDRNIEVNKGDWLGNMGGDKGMPGSGSSTTGSHLHMGYINEKGRKDNPEELLNRLMRQYADAGDSTVTTEDIFQPSEGNETNLDFTGRSLGDMLAYNASLNEDAGSSTVDLDSIREAVANVVQSNKGTSEVQKHEHTVTKNLNVSLSITGEGAGELNNATSSQLEHLVKQILREQENQRIAMNPTAMGWE